MSIPGSIQSGKSSFSFSQLPAAPNDVSPAQATAFSQSFSLPASLSNQTGLASVEGLSKGIISQITAPGAKGEEGSTGSPGSSGYTVTEADGAVIPVPITPQEWAVDDMRATMEDISKNGVSPETISNAAVGAVLGTVGKKLLKAAHPADPPKTVKSKDVDSPDASPNKKTDTPSLWVIPKNIEDKIPEGWSKNPNKKQIGFRWEDPNNRGNGVRVDKGNPDHGFPSQQVDHVIVRSEGKVIGRNGNPISGTIKENHEQSHIPLSEYETWNAWNSPK